MPHSCPLATTDADAIQNKQQWCMTLSSHHPTKKCNATSRFSILWGIHDLHNKRKCHESLAKCYTGATRLHLVPRTTNFIKLDHPFWEWWMCLLPILHICIYEDLWLSNADWHTYKYVLNKSPNNLHKFIGKLVHGWLSSNKRQHIIDLKHSPKYSFHQEIESTEYIVK